MGTCLAGVPSLGTALHGTQRRGWANSVQENWDLEADSVGAVLRLEASFGVEGGIWGQPRVGHVQMN